MPGPWRSLWEGWKNLARKIGNFQARVILMVFYFVVVCPFALVVRWTSDPLSLKRGTPRGWRPKPEEKGAAMDRARRQS
jgi:hypothetical protein